MTAIQPVGLQKTTFKYEGEAEIHNIRFASRHHGSRKKLETIIGDVTDTFRKPTPAVKQEFVRKSHGVSY